MDYALRQAYSDCARETRREAKNFYIAFLTLPRRRRRAIYALYTFCRVVDDAADLAPSLSAGKARLAELRQALEECLAGRPQQPLFLALADAIKRFRLDPDLLRAVLNGVEQDLRVNRYADFASLQAYCWQVAAAVGLLSLQIFGYRDPTAKRYAEDLGLAMQLANILRDIKEDLERDRIYLPQDELAAYGVSVADLRAGAVNNRFRRFMQFQISRARALFASGAKLTPLVNFRSRPCPMLLQAVYTRLLQQIEEADYDVFSRRIGPSGKDKLLILFNVWLKWILSFPSQIRKP